jgi:hypothetical protein
MPMYSKNISALVVVALLSLATTDARAGWMVSRDGNVKEPPQVVHAVPVVQEQPLLAALPPSSIEEPDTSSDTDSFSITVVDTDGHDTHASPLAEYIYHTQGNPATYKGEPYMNFRGYQNTSGYANDFGGYDNFYGYDGGYSY